MTFSELAWDEVQPILKEIFKHPFISELITGKLEEIRFAFYLQQDWMYLNEFSQTLAHTSLLAPNLHDAANLIKFSHEVNIVEQGLHLSFFRLYDVPKKASLTSACFNYTNFLRATVARGSYSHALAAVLPCFWVYQHVGQYIVKLAEPINPYSEWIKTYSSEEFADGVQLMIETTNFSMADKSSTELAEAIQIFKASAYFELQFWHDAYYGLTHSFETSWKPLLLPV